MYGTKGMASFTLYPDKAYIEIKGQLYNRTNLPQTFLWWANPAIPVNDHTQSIFPPDVHAVMDHGKRDLSRFPIATGTYYKHDYGAGVDISRYKNIPVPTSYMAYHSDYDFVGGYDYEKEAGILHIADHHVSPGKKQWTWGCGDFGQAWDRNLTDEDGPYIELATGMFTDNQPDFTWLAPFEEKTFTQYFMPYKKVGCVQNASTEAVLGLDVQAGEAHVERSLMKNAHNLKARGLRTQILLQLGRNEAALTQLEENLRLDPFDYRSRLVREMDEGLPHDETLALMGNRASSFIECAIDFAEAGFYTHAIETLRLCSAASPMLKYYEAFYLEQNGNSFDAAEAFSEAANRSPRCCFPNRLEDVKVLSFALNRNQTDARAPYYLGCLFYDKRRYEEA